MFLDGRGPGDEGRRRGGRRDVLMVGYPKRYDPAFQRFRDCRDVADPRLLRVTTFEAPFLPYVGHYPLAPARRSPRTAIAAASAENRARITRAIGDADAGTGGRRTTPCCWTLWSTRLNTLRGVLGEPTSLEYVDLQPGQLTCFLKFGELSVAIHWMDLPG